MRLSKLAARPQLVKITIADESVVDRYGEALEFWIYDRQDMETFVKLASMTTDNFGDIAVLVRDLILDEDGTQILKDGMSLPNEVLMRAVTEVVDTLGKQLAGPTPEPKA